MLKVQFGSATGNIGNSVVYCQLTTYNFKIYDRMLLYHPIKKDLKDSQQSMNDVNEVIESERR